MFRLKLDDMKCVLRYNTLIHELSIDMSNHDAHVFLSSLDSLLRGDSTAEDRIIIRNFSHKFRRFLQDI
ncbi:unknown [Prevotella sp. CAG:1185]|nr:unknown [Prevotella sp. CAG:1185]